MLLKLNFPKNNEVSRQGRIVLAGDIGATKSNLALFRVENGNFTSLREAQFKSNDYRNIIELTDSFMKGGSAPDTICFGVAGPVINGHAKLSNIKWDIDSQELSVHFNVKSVLLINDLEATAFGLAMLDEKELKVLHKGSEVPVGNAAVIAPGTGLGEAGIFWDGNYYHPFATEGGHSDFAPRNLFDFELYSFLQKKFGHVSWERLVCGPGIVNIYHFLRDEKKREEPAWLKAKMENKDAASVISKHADQNELCKETMQLFVRYLAHESANLVLKLKATGGLFIGGGIAPHLISLLEDAGFYTSYCDSGRLNYLLEMVPVSVILNTRTALLGAANYGASQLMEKEQLA